VIVAYIGRETFFFYHKPFQEDGPKNRTAHQQHSPENADAKTPNPVQIQQIRSIQTDMPGLQQGSRADGKKLHTKV